MNICDRSRLNGEEVNLSLCDELFSVSGDSWTIPAFGRMRAGLTIDLAGIRPEILELAFRFSSKIDADRITSSAVIDCVESQRGRTPYSHSRLDA